MPVFCADFLPPIGNDIVDLRERDSRFDKIHPRFFEKVFAEDERAFLKKEQKNFLFWAVWAGKEAAYKYMVQKKGHLPFLYKQFVVAADFSKVVFQGEEIPLQVVRHPAFVYAFTDTTLVSVEHAAKQTQDFSYLLDSQTWKLLLASNIHVQEAFVHVKKQMQKTANEFSLAVRVLTLLVLAQMFSLPPQEIFIKNLQIPQTRIPAAFYKNKMLPVRISFTHHGDFFAAHLLSIRDQNMPQYLPQTLTEGTSSLQEFSSVLHCLSPQKDCLNKLVF